MRSRGQAIHTPFISRLTALKPTSRRRVAGEQPPERLDLTTLPRGLGEGWQSLLSGLEARLRELDPEAYITRVQFGEGHLVTGVHAPEPVRRAADRLAREAQHSAAAICESCGASGRPRAVVGIVIVQCDGCAERPAGR